MTAGNLSSLLRVERSVLQSRWVLPQVKDDSVDRLMKDHALPEMVARLLVARQVGTEQVEQFLNPRLSRDFPDPFSLQGMRAFADDLAVAIVAGKKIAAFCDFDVDGSTSAAILTKFFRHLGQEIPVYIPDRLTEGYGPNIKALQTLKASGAEIVLMADCGTTAFDVLAAGRAIGLEISVLDHHEAETELPAARHVINPKRRDDTSGLSMLCAAGVTFLSCIAINAALRERNFYTTKGMVEPPLKTWLDLVALATVCDMVPLTGANRLLVKAGFQEMAKGENVGLKALCAVAGLKKAPTPDDAGFIIGPRINAGSRVHQSDLGAKLLACEDAEEARNIAWVLNDCNARRKELQAEMMRDAVTRIEMNGWHADPILFVHDKAWHVGLNGLVAGGLKEKYGKPACVVAFAPGPDGRLEGRGSGRSVPGFNLAGLFVRAREAGLLLKGGGHAMAAGFTVSEDQLDDLHAFFRSEAAQVASDDTLVCDEAVDGLALIRGLTPDFVRLLDSSVGPFGTDNPQPQFVIPSARIVMADVVGESHIRLQITDTEGGARMKAMAFRAVGTPLGDALLSGRGRVGIHLMGRFAVNEWNGRESVEFHVRDAALQTGYPLEKSA